VRVLPRHEAHPAQVGQAPILRPDCRDLQFGVRPVPAPAVQQEQLRHADFGDGGGARQRVQHILGAVDIGDAAAGLVQDAGFFQGVLRLAQQLPVVDDHGRLVGQGGQVVALVGGEGPGGGQGHQQAADGLIAQVEWQGDQRPASGHGQIFPIGDGQAAETGGVGGVFHVTGRVIAGVRQRSVAQDCLTGRQRPGGMPVVDMLGDALGPQVNIQVGRRVVGCQQALQDGQGFLGGAGVAQRLASAVEPLGLPQELAGLR